MKKPFFRVFGKIWLAFFAIFFASSLPANTRDSLLFLIEKAPTDLEKSIQFARLSEWLFDGQQFQEAQSTAREALFFAQKSNDARAEGKAFYLLGLAAHQLGQRDSAVIFCDRSANLLLKNGDPAGAADAFFAVLHAFTSQGKHAESLAYFEKNEQMTAPFPEKAPERWLKTLNLLAQNHQSTGKMDAAKRLLEKAVALDEAKNIGLPRPFYSLHLIYLERGNFGRAYEMLEKGRRHAQKKRVPMLENAFIHSLGTLFLEIGDVGAALGFFKTGVENARNQKSPVEQARFYISIANALIEDEKLDLAKNYLDSADLLPGNMDDLRSGIRHSYARIEAKKGNLQPLFDHLKSDSASQWLVSPDPRMRQQAVLALAKVFYEVGDFKKSAQRLLECLEICQANRFAVAENKTLKMLLDVYRQTDQRAAEATLFPRYLAGADSLNRLKILAFNGLTARMATSERDLEIARQQAEIIEKRQKMERTAFAFVLFSILGTAGAIWFWRRFLKVRKAAAQKEIELKFFNYAVGHDLQKPLVNIRQASEWLEKGSANLSETDRAELKIMQFEAEKMKAMLDRMLHFSAADSEAILLVEVDLNALLADVLRDFELKKVAQKAEIRVARLPVLTADRVLLGQVFENLVSNALKFSKDARPPILEIGSEQKGSRHELFVRDNGVGFAPGEAGRLFGLFYSAHPGEDFGGGSGLGLAIVKRIVERHGAEIWATSAGKNCGATFFLSWPIG